VSKGLGKIEIEILTILKNARMKDIKTPNFPVILIARLVYKSSFLGGVGRITHSQYTSVCRSVESLERKNYVKTEIITRDDKRFRAHSIALKKVPTRMKIVNPGERMYEEKEWLRWYKKRDRK